MSKEDFKESRRPLEDVDDLLINDLSEERLVSLRQKVNVKLRSIKDAREDESWRPHIGKCYKYDNGEETEYCFVRGNRGSVALATCFTLKTYQGGYYEIYHEKELLNLGNMEEISLDQFTGAYTMLLTTLSSVRADVVNHLTSLERKQEAKTSDE